MLKAAFLSSLIYASLTCGLLVRPMHAQDAAQPQPPSGVLLTDPKALLSLAAKSNGLTGPDAQPWHLTVSYKFLDEQGQPKDQGTFEELWASSTRYKQTFAGQNYARTEFGTPKGIVFTGTHETPRSQLMEMEREFVAPLPEIHPTASLQVEAGPLDLGTMHLSCLEAHTDTGVPLAGLSDRSFCINEDKPALRITNIPLSRMQYIHNHLVSYQGRFVASDLVLKENGKTVFTAHLESVVPLTDADSALLQPSPEAAPLENEAVLPRVVSISESVSQGMLLRKIAPDYPPIALAQRVTGIVVLQAIIGKDGHIRNLHVVSGSKLLQQAAMDAVQKWVYRPYLLLGEPVEVQTTVNVVFSLNGHIPGK